MSDNVIEATDDSFKDIISEGICLVDFSAEWCGPCKAQMPILEDLASKNENIKVVKVDIEKCSRTAQDMKVRSIPTIMFFKDGNEERTLIGLKKIEELQEEIDKFVE